MNKPLAKIIRPETIYEVAGQQHLLCKDSLIYQMVKYQKVYSLIFYGPPGVGKTSLAIALSKDLHIKYSMFNAVIDSKAKLVELIELAKLSQNEYVIIVEEIHRLNKDKQDILLPFLEKGIVKIFASTTENPFFSINPAIRSRCQVLELKPLTSDDMFNNLKLLIKSKKINNLKIYDELLKFICELTNGDYRSTINIVDVLINLYPNQKITKQIISQVTQNKFIVASKYGDAHYDLLSALHKSIRGSDPDAAIYYGAQLISQGDLIALNRRLIACSYEDIGLANPQLCDRVINATKAAIEVGYPECKQIYADIIIEMCLSPKSNSGYMAMYQALDDIEHGKIYPIPNHIKDQSYASASKLGRKGYKYPHDYGGYVVQQYLPDKLKDKKYYQPLNNGIEQKLNAWIELMKNKK